MTRLALILAALLTGALAGATDDPPPADPTLIGDQARAISATVKRDAKQLADAAREGTQQAAATAKGVAKDVASSAKDGAQQVGETTRKGAQKVKSRVSGEKPAPAVEKAPPAADTVAPAQAPAPAPEKPASP